MFLAGCARFEAEPLSPQRTAAQFEARTLDAPRLKMFLERNSQREFANWPLQEWDCDSLTLVALFYHPSLDVARAQWAVAQAGVRTAGGRLNPTAETEPQYTTNAERGVSPWVAGVVFQGTIETAGKRSHRIRRAEQESESARLNLATQAWQVRSRLRVSLLDYAAVRRRVALLQDLEGVQSHVLELMEGRLAAGAVAATELTADRMTLIKTRADLAEAQRQIVENRAAVAEALGLPLKALDGRELMFDLSVADLSRDADPQSAELRQRALYGRADILASLADYAASQAALQLEIANQYPDIRLGPGYEFDQGERKWGLAVGADLPVFNRNEGPIAEAQAKRAEAAARFLALQAEVISEIDRALVAVAASREQLHQIEVLTDMHRKQVRTVEESVKLGAADQLELSSARMEMTATELTRLDALIKVQQAIGRLEDAVQAPWEALSSIEQNPRAEAMKEDPS